MTEQILSASVAPMLWFTGGEGSQRVPGYATEGSVLISESKSPGVKSGKLGPDLIEA